MSTIEYVAILNDLCGACPKEGCCPRCVVNHLTNLLAKYKDSRVTIGELVDEIKPLL